MLKSVNQSIDMKRIYIAGKVTGLPIAECTMKFATAQVALQKKYPNAEVINPLAVVNDFHVTWQDAMTKCLQALLTCDTVYLLPCWQNSRGACIERNLALTLEKQLIYEDSFTEPTILPTNNTFEAWKPQN